MEQATNLFNKGLLMDTHPMVQSNDSLTDCLNGTLITMNGNEVILQNDMGNRRVDNAFLPAGYEPVGMKEYGGIIYIAAYNPITNKSQIGSFPSPERKISGMDEEVLSKKTFNYNLDRFSYLTKNINGTDYRFITGDTLLFPLTDKTTLHAGDKFTVYGNIGNTNNISNYHNIKDNKVYSPKNRLYTFSIGVLNSLNEFVDITKSLVRWDDNNNEWNIHKFSETDTDLYKFNYQYFIPGSFKNTSLIETMNDANFIEERLKIAANTYSYKLIGPLYLKVQLNHFLKFNYSITGHKDLNGNTFTLLVETYYVYNCPDGLVESEFYNTYDDNYSTYEEGKVDPSKNENKWFTLRGQFIPEKKENGLKEGTLIEESIVSSENVSYNPETNLYTVKIVKTFKFNLSDREGDHLFKYYLNVYANNHSDILYNTDENNNGRVYFFDGLSDEGVIDINKLGSGEIEIKGWRFLNDSQNKTTTLNYQITAYNLSNDPFTKILFKFKDILSGEGGISRKFDILNNSSGINILWEDNDPESTLHLIPQKLYIVDLIAFTSSGSYRTIENIGWILTTDLFNSCYAEGSSDSISDFRYPSNEREQNIFNDKTTIKYELNLGITDESSEILSELDNQLKWLSMSDREFNIEYTHKYNLKLKCTPKLQIINREYYPENLVDLEKSINIDEFNLSIQGKNNENSNLFQLLNELIKNNSNGGLDKKFVEDPVNVQINNNTITGTINFYDIFYSSNGTSDFMVKNLFSNGCGYLETKIIKNDDKNLTNFEYTFTPMYGGINLYTLGAGDEVDLDVLEVRKVGESEPNKPYLYTWVNGGDNRKSERNGDTEINSTTGSILYNVSWCNVNHNSYHIFDYDLLSESNGNSLKQGSIIQDQFLNLFGREGGILIYFFHPGLCPLPNIEKESSVIGFDKLYIYPDFNHQPWAKSHPNYPTSDISTKKSRVWWKDINDNWVLIYDESLLNTENENCVIDIELNISSFLAKYVFGHDDFIYCYRRDFNFINSEVKIFAPNKNTSKYNHDYSINGQIIKFILSSNNSNSIIQTNNNFNNTIRNKLGFEFKVLLGSIEYKYSYTLNENNSFIEQRRNLVQVFENYLNNGFDSIYVNYSNNQLLTSFLDKNGNKLTKGYVYIIEDDNLRAIKNGYNVRENGNYYTILCSNKNKIINNGNDCKKLMDIRKCNASGEGSPITFVYTNVPITIPTNQLEYDE